VDKLKKFYRNNRIYCILMLISLACLIIILISVLLYFTNQTKTSEYGNRLDDVSSYPVETEMKAMEDYFNSIDYVESVVVRLQGKIIYVTLHVQKDKLNEDVELICNESLTKLTEEQKSFYEVQYIVIREGVNTYLGSKSSSETVISWINYQYEIEEETTTAVESSEATE